MIRRTLADLGRFLAGLASLSLMLAATIAVALRRPEAVCPECGGRGGRHVAHVQHGIAIVCSGVTRRGGGR